MNWQQSPNGLHYANSGNLNWIQGQSDIDIIIKLQVIEIQKLEQKPEEIA